MTSNKYIAPAIRWTELDTDEIMDIEISSEGDVTGTIDDGTYNGEFSSNHYSLWDDPKEDESESSFLLDNK